jgi:predicted phage terminase large subunit-like protein
LNVSPSIILDLIKNEKLRRLAQSDLMAFTRQSFDIIEPGQAFCDNWHLHVIADHLMAISRGDIKNLVINIPPGCMKSILTSVAWPAWEWVNNPMLRVMSASYGSDLAIRDASKTRDIVTSEWYQERWSDVKIKQGSDQKTKYELVTGGWRMATSVGGRATGEHPDRKIVDDPHNAKQAESEAERESALTWFDRTLSTRGQSRGASTVVVMQRLHERDVTGHILADLSGYTHVCIPMEYDKVERKTFLGSYDPRKTEGELLWPEMFNGDSVEELKQLLGSYGSAGQLQQRPSPAGGGIIKTDRFRLWPSSKAIPDLFFVVQSYDTAFTERTSGDPTGCCVWGIFEHEGRRNVLLLDCWNEHLGYPALKKRVMDDWQARYGGEKDNVMKPSRKPDIVLVEAKGSGQSLLQDLRLSNIPAVAYNPGKADKVSRAHMATPLLEADIFWVLESNKNKGRVRTWVQPFLDQLEQFPAGEHDEMVDCFTQATIYLRDTGQLEVAVVPDDEPDDIDYSERQKARVNPYG